MISGNLGLILEYVRTVREQQHIIQQLGGYVDAANNRMTDVITSYITDGIVREIVTGTIIPPNAVNSDNIPTPDRAPPRPFRPAPIESSASLHPSRQTESNPPQLINTNNAFLEQFIIKSTLLI